MENNNNQVLNIPKFEIASTCENGSNSILRDQHKQKRFKFNLIRKKQQLGIENLTPIEIFQVDRKILQQKELEAKQQQKPDFSPNFLNWMINIQQYVDSKRQTFS